MKWGNVQILYALWLLIPAAWLLFALARRRRRQLEQLIDASVLPGLTPGWNPGRRRTRQVLWLCAVALAIIALARPQWGFHWQEVTRRGLDVMVVLDTSRSMLATDLKPTRFQQAKWGIRDFVQGLKGDRVGLIAFAGSSFLQCPLTIDYAAFMMTLDDVYVGIIPRGGTAIEQALQSAVDGFEEEGDVDRAVLLITDGEDHEGTPLGLAEELRGKNIRIYAAGVGTIEGVPISLDDKEGESGYLKDAAGHVIKSSLQESTIERLALATGGAYVRCSPGDLGLEQLLKTAFADLKRTEGDSRMVKVHEDRFSWFVAAALLLLLVEAALGEAALRRRAPALVLVLAFLGLPTAVRAGGEAESALKEGLRLHEEQEYAAAAAAFGQAATAAADAEKLDEAVPLFNQAVALARLQKAEEARPIFQEALRSPDLALQAAVYFNLGNLLWPEIEQLKKGGDAPALLLKYREILDLYEKSMMLAPEDNDAKVNFELALRELTSLENFILHAGTILTRAHDLVEKRKYEPAKALLTGEMEGYKTWFESNKKLKEEYEGVVKRLDDIIGILHPPEADSGK